MTTRTDSGHTTTYRVTQDGRVIAVSGGSWYSLMHALLRLAVERQIDFDDLAGEVARSAPPILDCGDEAARGLNAAIFCRLYEPGCGCDPYKGCGHPPVTDEQRIDGLRELLEEYTS